MSINKNLRQITDWLRERNIEHRVVKNKHAKIYFMHGGREYLVSTSITPSCPHACKNAIRDIERIRNKA